MNQEYLNTIKETTTGFEVKNLRWLPVDNIIVGLVKDPIWGRETLHDGFISGAWRKNGTPTNRIKNRTDLALPINLSEVIN
jgi:hypothetical protein